MRVMRRRRARHALTQLIGNRLEDRDLAHSGCLAERALRNHRGVMPLTHCNFSFDLMQLVHEAEGHWLPPMIDVWSLSFALRHRPSAARSTSRRAPSSA